MKTIEQRVLRGPNLWSRKSCLQTVVDMGDMAGCMTTDLPGFGTRLLDMVPSLHEFVAGPVNNGSFVAEVLGQLTLQLQVLVGAVPECRFVAAVRGKQSQVKIIVAYGVEKVAVQAFDLAADVISALCAGEQFDLAPRLQTLRVAAERAAIGTSTAAVVNAAKARAIPVIRLTEEANLFQLGWGSKQKRLQATVTGETSHVAVGIAGNKQLTKSLLEQGGIPVPKGGVAASVEEAVALAERLRYPVTLKPLDGNQGKGVTTRCLDEAGVAIAFEFAREHARRVIVERFIEGRDYRVLVTGKRVAAASLRSPPAVVGDGVSTVEQLVALENANPARGEGHTNILTRISIDESAEALLAEQGYHRTAVPPIGALVQLRGNANLSTGGTAEDVTDLLHPDTRDMCIRAARSIGLDIAGIDVVCTDISAPLRPQGGAIIEINAAPGIRMHEYPSQGRGRNAGDAIVEAMFGTGDGRIPVVAVTGTNGKTTTSLMIAHCARMAGHATGVTTTEGVYINGQRIVEGDCAGYHSARVLLTSPDVDFAVLETARGGILKRGLAFDRCSVGVVLNVSADHLGLEGIETVEQLAKVKGVVALAASGAVVLNADDRHCVTIATQVDRAVERIWFSMDPDNHVLLRHLENGGRAAYFQDNALVLADGERRVQALLATDMPAAMGGHARYNIANGLAAAAALMGSGFTHAQIAGGLASFVSDADSNPLRSNVYRARGVTVVVDYAHNPAAYMAMAAMARSLSSGRRIAVLTSPGDRRDDELHDIGRTCAAGFDELFVYEADPRGRTEGDTARTIIAGAREAGKAEQALHAIVPVADAFEAALTRCAPGDILVFACGSAATARAQMARFADADSFPSAPGYDVAPVLTPP